MLKKNIFAVCLLAGAVGPGAFALEPGHPARPASAKEAAESAGKAAAAQKTVEAFWKADVEASGFSDRSTTNQVLTTSIYGKINWRFLDSLSIHAKGLIIGRNGFTQSIYDRADRRGGFHFLEGFFDISLLPFLSVKLGNIQQDFLHAPLLMTDKTFPSAQEAFSFELSEDFRLSLVFQQAIPDNARESARRSAQIIRGAPLFLTSSVFAEWDSVSRHNLFLKESLTFFYYTKLSPAVADQSNLYGNTIVHTGSESRFRYKYFGLYSHFSLQAPFASSWIGELGLDVLYNFMAPDTFNQGEKLSGSLYYDYNSFMEIQMALEYFASQSDASVAYYNSSLYGRNNRKGGLLRAQAHLYDSGLTFGAVYVYSRPINHDRSSVGTSHAFSLSLGTNYVPI